MIILNIDDFQTYTVKSNQPEFTWALLYEDILCIIKIFHIVAGKNFQLVPNEITETRWGTSFGDWNMMLVKSQMNSAVSPKRIDRVLQCW